MSLDAPIFDYQTQRKGFQIGLSTKAGETQFLSGLIKSSLLLVLLLFLFVRGSKQSNSL